MTQKKKIIEAKFEKEHTKSEDQMVGICHEGKPWPANKFGKQQ